MINGRKVFWVGFSVWGFFIAKSDVLRKPLFPVRVRMRTACLLGAPLNNIQLFHCMANFGVYPGPLIIFLDYNAVAFYQVFEVLRYEKKKKLFLSS